MTDCTFCPNCQQPVSVASFIVSKHQCNDAEAGVTYRWSATIRHLCLLLSRITVGGNRRGRQLAACVGSVTANKNCGINLQMMLSAVMAAVWNACWEEHIWVLKAVSMKVWSAPRCVSCDFLSHFESRCRHRSCERAGSASDVTSSLFIL